MLTATQSKALAFGLLSPDRAIEILMGERAEPTEGQVLALVVAMSLHPHKMTRAWRNAANETLNVVMRLPDDRKAAAIGRIIVSLLKWPVGMNITPALVTFAGKYRYLVQQHDIEDMAYNPKTLFPYLFEPDTPYTKLRPFDQWDLTR